MLSILIFFALLGCSIAIPSENLFDQEYENFKLKYEKNYTLYEHIYRKIQFLRNRELIAEHNRKYYNGESTFFVGVNSNSDKLHQELMARNGFNMTKAREMNRERTFMKMDSDIGIPDSIDWRTKGAVTPIKDQGFCGSCWAFSSTGALEGQHFRKTGDLVSLSEQNLVDCSQENYGCDGGTMTLAFQFIKQEGGIDTETSYPYTSHGGKCVFNPNKIGAEDSGYISIPEGDEEALKHAVATVGPISIAMDASDPLFAMYKGGIYGPPLCSTTNLDHAILVVGYGTDETNHDYWIVKNSWGTIWGMDGYFYLARNTGNMCGVASLASYPTV